MNKIIESHINLSIDFNRQKINPIAAMGGGGGGGETTGYSPMQVIAAPSPAASLAAANLQANAAREAAKIAQEAMNDAIKSVNQQFNAARYDLKPYRTTGVQALDKLNQYLGLDPYNPGPAPKEPKKMTMDEARATVTDRDVKDHIRANTTYTYHKGSAHPMYEGYMGEGYQGPAVVSAYSSGSPVFPGAEVFMTDRFGINVSTLAKEEAAMDEMEKQNQDFEERKTAYDQDLPEWQQNLDWYNQYKGEGPKTSAQVTEDVANQPGYQALLGQGVEAINRSAAAKGSIQSGGMLRDLNQYGGGLFQQFYGDMLSRLSNQAAMGANAAGQTADLAANKGNLLAGIKTQYGDTAANAALAAGNARAQGLLGAQMEYHKFGGEPIKGGGGGGGGGIGSALSGIGSIIGAFSSKKLKKKVKTPSTKTILENVKELNIDKWKYKGIDRTHIGPYAEEFADRFGVGDGQTVNMIDMMGVLFASIKELAKKQGKMNYAS